MARVTNGIFPSTTGNNTMWMVAVLATFTIISIMTIATAEPEVLLRNEHADADLPVASAGNSRRLLARNGFHRRKRAIVTDRTQLLNEAKGYSQLDVVFALERSSLWPNSKRNFVIEQKTFVRSLIRDFLYVKQDATRIAVITYGTDVSVIFDGLVRQTISKCDVLGTDNLWDQVRFFDGARSQGTNLTGVFRVAKDILIRGRELRQNARSYFILLTSAQYQGYTPALDEQEDWFDTYGVGVSDNVDMVKLSALVANSFTNIYGSIQQWRETMRAAMEKSHVIVDSNPEWVPFTGVACNKCFRGNNECWCDVRTGFTRCGCPGGYIDNTLHCFPPCSRTVCPQDRFSCHPTFQGINYECMCYNNNPRCDIRSVIDCPIGACQNGGTCFEGRNQYACVCVQGFGGVHCEINEDECRHPDVCPHNTLCIDGVSSYRCVDSNSRPVPPPAVTPVPPPGITPAPPATVTPAPPPTVTPAPPPGITPAPPPPVTPAPPPAATHSPTIYPPSELSPPFPATTKRIRVRTTRPTWRATQPLGITSPVLPRLTNQPSQKKSTTLTPSIGLGSPVASVSSGGFLGGLNAEHRLLLTVVPPAGLGLFVLLIGIGTLLHIMRRRKGDHKKRNLSTVTDTTSIASHSPSLVTFGSECYTDEGTPGPPRMPKAVEAVSQRVSYGEFDDTLYGNMALQRGMEDWYSYVLDLYHNHGLNRILIIRLDGEKWVLSPGSKLNMKEVEAIFNLLSKKMIQGTFLVQGREFGIVGNNDFVIMAHTFRNSKRAQEILCATKTRQFVIIGSADFASDGGRCKAKMLELRDHIKVQGL